MGTSGGVITIPPIPTSFRIAVPTLPLIAVGSYTATIAWGSPLPDAEYSTFIGQDALLGKALAEITAKTANDFTLRVTASLLLAAGAQVHVLAWSYS